MVILPDLKYYQRLNVMGKINIRTKGQGGEREIVKLLTPVVIRYYPDSEITRNLEQSRSGGYDISGVPGFAIEVKRQEILHLKQWWAQTVKQAIISKSRPVLIYRQNRKPWRVVISLHELRLSGVTQEYKHTLEMSLDAFLLWFETNLALDELRENQ